MTAPDITPDPEREPCRLLDEILEEAVETGAIAGWSRVTGSETYTIWHPDGPTVRVTVEVPEREPVRLGELLPDAVDQLAEWRRTGYLPPEVCAQLHPFDAAVRCHRPRGHGGGHTDDGQDPWTEENDHDRA